MQNRLLKTDMHDEFGLHTLIGQKFAGLPFPAQAPEVDGDELGSRINYYHEGVEIHVDPDWIASGMHLYGRQELFRQYEGRLPGELRFSMSRSEVRDILGTPFEGWEEPRKMPILGWFEPEDRFAWQGFRLCVRYHRGCVSIERIFIDRQK